MMQTGKTIHLIRHGQSAFNAAGLKPGGEDPMLFDAALSDLGHRQVAEARRQVADLACDLVVTTPLTRALQTCLGLFDGRRVAIMVDSRAREKLSHSCDVGRPPAALQSDFPNLSFGHLAECWWYAGPDHAGGPWDGVIRREPEAHFMTRVGDFRRWLHGRPEPAVTVVGHSDFFKALSGRSLENCEVYEMKL